MNLKLQIFAAVTVVLAAAMPLKADIDHLLPWPQRLTASGAPVNTERAVIVTMVDSIAGARETPLYGYPAEAYTLEVDDSTVRISAVTERGVIRARNTLAQLQQGVGDSLPQIAITDWPAFPLRGYMHDTGRSYIPIDTLMRHIELLSQLKINTFHWHLTENQAWRLAIDAFPQLTADTAMTRHPGGFYTKDECRRLEAAAAELGVTVIPEIDMPGHSAAFRRAMGFDMQSDEGEEALRVILREAAEAFPLAPYFHIGGDEVPIRRAGFLRRMTDFVRSLGYKAVVWNPIHGTVINDTVGADMTHMWGSAGRKVEGLPNIDSRYIYANHFDPFADVASILRSNIYYQPQASPEVAGAIVGIWNDRLLPDAKAIVRDNSFYPSVAAIAERAWRGGGEGYVEELGCLLPVSGEGLKEVADWERRFLYQKEHLLEGEAVPYVAQTNIRWRVSEPVALDAEPDTTRWRPAAGGTVYLRHTWGDIVPGMFRGVKPGCKVKMWTRVWNPVDTVCGAIVETQNYSRSERDLAPEPGQWDRRGSEIRVNGERLVPPVWANSGQPIDNEKLLLNENATARRPVLVHLHKGWNTIEADLPYVDAEGVRLDKWMLTFVLTDSEGREALECIRYEP